MENIISVLKNFNNYIVYIYLILGIYIFIYLVYMLIKSGTLIKNINNASKHIENIQKNIDKSMASLSVVDSNVNKEKRKLSKIQNNIKTFKKVRDYLLNK
ncbi:MAG: hypothetical protein ACK5KQ_06450 [Anaerorhabdus sp.]